MFYIFLDKNMSKSKLVKTTFQSGPDDGLLAVDIYESESGEVVNSYDKTESEALDVLDTLNGKASAGSPISGLLGLSGLGGLAEQFGSNLLSDLVGGLDLSNPFTNLNPDVTQQLLDMDESVARYSNEDINAAAAIREMSDPVKNQFLIPKTDANNVFGTFSDVTKKISTVLPITDTRNIGNLVNNISKGNYPTSYVDKGALSNLISNTVNMASIAKLPKAFSTIAQYSGIDTRVLTKAATSAINVSLQRGDIEVFKDVARTSIANDLKYAMPNVVNRVIGSVERPREVTYNDTPRYYQEARDSFTRVDPNWNKTVRGSGSVINGTAIATNPFMMQCVRSSVTAQPLVIKTSSSGNLGNYIDPEYADISVPEVFNSVHGTNHDTQAREKIISDWKADTNRIQRANERKDDSYLMLMEKTPTRSVVDTLRSDFPMLPLNNNSISNFIR